MWFTHDHTDQCSVADLCFCERDAAANVKFSMIQMMIDKKIIKIKRQKQ